MAHGPAKSLTFMQLRFTVRHPGRALRLLAVAAVLLCRGTSADAGSLDEMSLERWAKLGEADRYQLNIAEKYFREQNWKTAASEYEKFLALYEKSSGAPFAQLKWSLCQANLRKLNTAIKDGYQSVIDYWPDSPEAVSASYFIAKTYKEMGDVKLAKKAYAKTLSDHGAEIVGALARFDLAEIARIEGDEKRRVALMTELAYHVPRKAEAGTICIEAAHQLATHYFTLGDFAAGLKAMATSHNENDLPGSVHYYIRGPLQTLSSTTAGKPTAFKEADAAVAYYRGLAPAAPADDAQKDRARHLAHYQAEVLLYAGRGAEAAKAYDDLIQRQGSDDFTLGNKAQLLKQIGQRDEARKTYARFVNQVEGQHQIAYSFREEQKADQAIPIYLELVTKDGQNAAKWQWQLAESYRDAGKFKEAIATFRQTDRFPEDLKQMAACHRRLGEFKEALALYRQVLSAADASAPGAMLETARTYEEAADKDAAIKAFQQVCKRYPKSGEASLAHARLQDGYKINATLGGAVDE